MRSLGVEKFIRFPDYYRGYGHRLLRSLGHQVGQKKDQRFSKSTINTKPADKIIRTWVQQKQDFGNLAQPKHKVLYQYIDTLTNFCIQSN